jgi:ribonuclease BN (tRNA processing enzyme)
MATSLTLLPLGVGDSRTTRHNYVQLVLNVDGRNIVIECPAYFRKALDSNNKSGERTLEASDLKEFIVTHIHADTVAGLEELSWYQAFGPVGRRKLYAPQWLLEDVWRILKPAMGPSTRFDPMINPWLGGIDGLVDLTSPEPPYWPYPAGPARFDWYFDPVEIYDDGQPKDLGGFTIACMLTRHIPRTVALKFDFGNFKFGFSSDTGFYPRLIEWLEECDLIVHDVLFGEPEPERNLHCPIVNLLTLPSSFQQRTLLVGYSDDAYEDDPDNPRYDVDEYRLLKQGKLYKLL